MNILVHSAYGLNKTTGRTQMRFRDRNSPDKKLRNFEMSDIGSEGISGVLDEYIDEFPTMFINVAPVIEGILSRGYLSRIDSFVHR